MKILSWNMLYSNARQDEAYSFLENSQADIICLQEVPAAFLQRLRALPHHLAHASEVDRIDRNSPSTHYVALLSRYPILRNWPFALDVPRPRTRLRTMLFTSVLFRLGLWARGEGNRNGICADVKCADDSLLRVLCVHLSLTTPAQRAQECALAMRELSSSSPNIVAGDLNVIDSRKLSILNWFLGGPLRSALVPTQERTAMEATFAQAGLKNPCIGRITHPLSASQLDHILVPAAMDVERVTIIENRYGSDHNPIVVETC